MEAIKTVVELALISDGKCEWFRNLPDYEQRNLTHQAEISFKAGQDSRLKEVKEWIKEHSHQKTPSMYGEIKFNSNGTVTVISTDELQAFLKGLEGAKK
jgi:isopentenyl phosphate kinase